MFFAVLDVYAQDKDLYAIIADIVESIADKNEEEEGESLEQLVDYYTSLAENPLNINTASTEDLEKLLFLTSFQIFSLKEYIKEYGQLVSVYELTLIPGYDQKTASCLYPFISVDRTENIYSPSIKDMITKGNSTLLTRSAATLEKRKGYYVPENPEQLYYKGSPYSLFTRYRYKFSNKLQIGISADKDAGEEFFKGSNKQGFDFYSMHIMLSERKYIKRLIVGDYRAAFGQGLALWNNFSFNKSSDVHAIRKRNNEFSAYSSADEVTYMRGIASTLMFNSLNISPFISYKKIDATMDEDGYTSLSANGLHRTKSEIDRKNALGETVAGINLGYEKTFWRIGATALHGRYNAEDHREIRPYNRFQLREPQNSNFAVDYRWLIKNISLFGEVAISSNMGKAILTGATIDVNHWMQLSTLYRNYEQKYQAVYSNAFSENSSASNEEGLYLGLSIIPFNSWKVSAYLDSYSFPWLRYGTNSPSSGWDYLLQANYTPNRDFDILVKLQQDKAVKNIPNSQTTITSTQNINRTRALLQMSYNVSPELSLRSRIAFSFFNPEMRQKEQGFLMYQEIKYKMAKIPLSFSVRYAIFDTDSWNTRLYAYESDILYAFSVPAYYDRGSRYYLNVSYKATNYLQLWFRISQTRYFEKDQIGSGLSAIDGNKQTDIKLQMQIKF